MTPVESFRSKSVAVFGLGGSGLSTARALIAGGANVSAWDDSDSSRRAAAQEHIPLVDLSTASWRDFAALVLSPGVPLTHPKPHWIVEKANAAQVPIIGDIELFCLERQRIAPQAPFVAITGTNGKSTTTALIAHLLKASGRDVALGGNIGTAVLDLPPPSDTRVHVLEISSFQIDLAPSLAPPIGVLTNITPDHLDRHGTMAHYASVKERLVASAQTAIIGVDDPWCRAIADRCKARHQNTIQIALETMPDTGVGLEGTSLLWMCGEDRRIVADLKAIPTLRGRHNAQNAAAAIAAVSQLGLTDDEIRAGLLTFPGLPHRLEMVGHVGRVLAINDSKATNADATEKALLSFEGGLFWIVGGRAKEGGIALLKALFPRVEKAYLIGESALSFAEMLDGHMPYDRSETLDVAVERALRDAQISSHQEPVVLLSPACASYDQFKNFEMRGDAFRQLISAAPGFVAMKKG